MKTGRLEYKMEQLLEMYVQMKRYSCYIKMRMPVENLEKWSKIKNCIQLTTKGYYLSSCPITKVSQLN